MGIASNREALFSYIVVVKECRMSTSLYMARVGQHSACCSSDWRFYMTTANDVQMLSYLCRV